MRARPLVVLLSCACPGSVAEPPPPPEAATASEPHAEAPAHAEAHARALERLRDAALPALEAFDPAGAAALHRAPLQPPPVSRGRRQKLREGLSPAAREREGIDPRELQPEPAMLLRALEHATYLIDDELAGKTPLRTEPGAYLDRLEPFVAQLERGLASRSLSAPDAIAALDALAVELPEAATQLGAVAPAATEAAIEDADALSARLRRLSSLGDPEVQSAAERAIAEVDALRDHLQKIAARSAEARAAERGRLVPPTADPGAVQRLPDRLGSQSLAKALAAEAVAETPSVLLSRLVLQIARLSAMADALPPETAGEAEPVTVERCEAAWQPIATWVETQPVLSAAKIDCEAIVRRLQDTRLDDTELSIVVADEGVTLPTREARRREVDPALALVGGDITPHAQRHALTISVLAGAGLSAAGRRATLRARDAACLAGAALVVHGEADTPLDVVGRLGAGCAHRSSEAWTADTLARPLRSLRGLGLSLLGTGPADALAMQRFWWAPLGLVRPLAQPPITNAPEPAPTGVKIEPLEPAP
jgi:hypothetical protein